MAPYLTKKEAAPASLTKVPRIMATSKLWTKEQVKLAFHLYCQIPFGRIYGRNPAIVALAEAIGRTPDAVAMKMLNIASLDPRVRERGLSGLGNASDLDRDVWAEFHADWDTASVEAEKLRLSLSATEQYDEAEETDLEDFTGEMRTVQKEQRLRQSVFRQRVLSAYQSRCCMSGLSEPRLLVASHIVPWRKDKQNRLNPSNGLCLSAIHDRAFDKGLITLSDDLRIIVLEQLKRRDEAFVQAVFLPLEGSFIALPERFVPDPVFIARHRSEEFIDNRKAA